MVVETVLVIFVLVGDPLYMAFILQTLPSNHYKGLQGQRLMLLGEWKKVRLNLAFLISAGSLRQPPPKEEKIVLTCTRLKSWGLKSCKGVYCGIIIFILFPH